MFGLWEEDEVPKENMQTTQVSPALITNMLHLLMYFGY